MAFVEVGIAFVRSLVVWLEANRAPAPTALWSLYLRLKAAPKSVTPIAITISKGNATANSRISDPSVPEHASSHLRQTVFAESVKPFLLSGYPHWNWRNACPRDRKTGVAGITPSDIQHHNGYVSRSGVILNP